MPSDLRDGFTTLDYALDQRPEGTVGFGLHSIPHAGETTRSG